MGKKTNVPEIRFQGFDEEWDRKMLEEMVLRASIQSSEVGMPRLEYEDIISGSGELNKNIYEKNSIKNGILFEVGDVLFGKLRPYLKNWHLPCFMGIAVGDFWVLRPIEKDSKYIYFMIQTDYFNNIANQSTGTKMPRADWNLVSKALFSFPSHPEQTKIGSYFKNLDQLITLKQRKLDKLKNVKKSMLEKMFPREGAAVPKIRFQGFSGKWEICNIGNIITEKRRPIELEDNITYRLVTVKRRNEGVIPRSLLKGKDILVKTYFSLQAGDYLISKRQVVHGANGIVPKTLDGAIVSNEYLVCVENDNITTDFLALISLLPSMYKKFFVSCYGVDIEKLFFDVDDWKKRELVIPTIQEQRKINTYFKNLDRLISLRQKEIEKLKQIKSSCLGKMFV